MGFRNSETSKAFHIGTNPETLRVSGKNDPFPKMQKPYHFFGNPSAFPSLSLYETLLRFPKLGNPFFPSKNLLKVSEISPETYSGFRNQPENLFGFLNARKPIFRGSRENDFYLECILQ